MHLALLLPVALTTIVLAMAADITATPANRKRLRPFLVLVALAPVALVAKPAAAAMTAPVVGIAATTTAPPAGPPVEVESCIVSSPAATISTVSAVASIFLSGQAQQAAWAVGAAAPFAVQPALTISAANESNVPIDLVRFKVVAPDGSIAYVRDAADYEPGAVLVHAYRDGVGISGTSFFQSPRGDACSVDWVRYANGAVWSADKAAAQR